MICMDNVLDKNHIKDLKLSKEKDDFERFHYHLFKILFVFL